MRALLALTRGDSAEARRILAEPDSSEPDKYMYMAVHPPFAAQAYYLLGDYETTLRMPRGFRASALKTGGFDSRWGMLGRVRLLRGGRYERLGRRAEARAGIPPGSGPVEGRRPALRPFIQQAQRGLARVGQAG